MKIESIDVRYWRNLEGVRIDVPPEAPVICLVGENGTGKSNLLELIAGVATVFGLNSGVQTKRGSPFGEPHSISASLILPSDFTLTVPERP
jgi:recombinational DNA repair ATPase RecF